MAKCTFGYFFLNENVVPGTTVDLIVKILSVPSILGAIKSTTPLTIDRSIPEWSENMGVGTQTNKNSLAETTSSGVKGPSLLLYQRTLFSFLVSYPCPTAHPTTPQPTIPMFAITS